MTDPETWRAARIAAGLPVETWKPVPGWPHEVSDQGRIRTAKGRVLTQRPHNRPREAPPERRYRKADLCRGAEKLTVLVHQIVLLGFAGPASPGQESRHLDDNPVHNWWPENLAWGTPDQNAADKARQARYHTPAAQTRRSEAAQRGRATQLAERDEYRRANTPSPQPKRGWWRRVTRHFPWPGRGLRMVTYNRRSEAPVTERSRSGNARKPKGKICELRSPFRGPEAVTDRDIRPGPE